MPRWLPAAVVALTLCLGVLTAPAAHADGTARIAGRVVDEDGRGLYQIRVRLNNFADADLEFSQGMTLTDDQGYYSFTVTPKSYLLWTDDDFYFDEFPPQFYPGVVDRTGAAPVDPQAGDELTIDLTLRSSFSNSRADTAPDPDDKSEVGEAFRTELQQQLDVGAPLPSDAEIRSCQAGTGSAAGDAATLRALNYARGLAGLPSAKWDADLSAKTRNVALLMQVNSRLDPYPFPPENWRCWSQEKFAYAPGSAQSHQVGARAVMASLAAHDDPSFNDDPANVVHRNNILDPQLETFGYGAYRSASALFPGTPVYAYESGRTTVTPRFASWPTAGWFPAQLLPYDRWSFDAPHMSYNFEHARVTVTRLGAQPQTFTPTTHVQGPYSPLVWDMPSVPAVIGSRTAEYRVTIHNISYRRRAQPDYTYTVRLFDPSIQISATSRAAITGTAQVGSTLTAKPPSWSVGAVTPKYQWLRDSRSIPGATKSTVVLTASDVGHRISVTITGTKPYHLSSTVTSSPSTPVTKKTAVTRLTASTKKRTVRLTLTVSAPGEPALSGRVTLKERSKVLKTANLANSQGSFKLTKVKRGRHAYTVNWAGNPRVNAVAATTSIKVK